MIRRFTAVTVSWQFLFALTVGPAFAAGDAERGAQLYESRCTGCHSLDANRVGPMHRGVYGRKAGTVAGFSYSPAVKNSTIVWDEATLDRWLANPQELIPGQRMGFRVALPEDRADIVAYLRRESGK
ncbi:MAG: cytochrome c family protein [Rhodospirillales bacterium]|nr:cytochrome c family protein [Rhodospirillales bacterium]